MCKKRNNHVLHDIEKITDPKSGVSEEFNVSNFGHITYKDSRGKNNHAMK